MLVKCQECKKEVSDRAETCVHCGFPLKVYTSPYTENPNTCYINDEPYNFGAIVAYISNIREKSIKNLFQRKEDRTIAIQNVKRKITELTNIKDPDDLYVLIYNNGRVPAFYTPPKPVNKFMDYKPKDQPSPGTVTCPFCRSTDVKKIGVVSRATGAYVAGIASKKIGKQWHCNKCGSDF